MCAGDEADDDRACVRTAASMAGDRRSDATATIAAAIRFLDIATSKPFRSHYSQPLFTVSCCVTPKVTQL
jgi:hypothetical protein